MGLLGSIFGAAIDVVKLPISVTKDVITMGGALTDQDEPYTVQNVEKLAEDAEDIEKALRSL